MGNDDKTPELREALRRTRPKPLKPVVPPEEEFPPPPKDWTAHPAVKAVGVVFLLAIIGVLWWKGPVWWAYMTAHPFGAGLAVCLLIALILIILVAYWRVRAQGKREDRYWKTD